MIHAQKKNHYLFAFCDGGAVNQTGAGLPTRVGDSIPTSSCPSFLWQGIDSGIAADGQAIPLVGILLPVSL